MIAIKDMKMPDSCVECPMLDGEYGWCKRDRNISEDFDERPSNCPFIEIAEVQDAVSRQAAIDAINGIINRFEQILRDIRESKVDDSVCGMCEYDGSYIGQSGDWCNECPGFDKDDCFKLSDKCRKRWLKSVDLSFVQPKTCEGCKHLGKWENEVEYGYPSPCTRCKRRVDDNYKE